MLHSLSYYYLLANIAIIVSYCLSKIINISIFKPFSFSFQQQLRITRSVFIGSIILFTSVPILIPLLPVVANNNFQLTPILRHAGEVIITQHSAELNTQVGNQNLTIDLYSQLLVIIFFIGMLFAFFKQVKNIQILKSYQLKSHRVRKIKNINLLVNHEIGSPFCWSFCNTHYVILPHSFFNSRSEFKIALQHEFQHIRQLDTYYLQLLSVFKVIFYLNPFVYLWQSYFNSLQEYACDEALILNKQSSVVDYAQCLLSTATNQVLPQIVLGIHGQSKNLLYRNN